MADPAPLVLQDNEFSCGAVALANAFNALGYSYAVGALAKMAGTSPTNGTSEEGVLRACAKLEHPCRVIEESHPGFALVTLRGFIVQGTAALLASDADTHWLAVIGVSGGRFLVHDPAAGTYSYNDTQLLERWRKSRSKAPFWGICIMGRGR